MIRLARVLILLCAGCSAMSVSGSHIVGGEITYTYKSTDRYLIRLVLFIDCYNGQPIVIAQDRFANIGVYSGTYDFLDSFSIERTSPERIDKINDTCTAPQVNACVDLYVYEKEVKLPPSASGYYLVFQRCCRNKTIANIHSPDQAGVTYFTIIPPDSVVTKNSSPVFNNLPPNFICAGVLLNFNHSATDLDGDSLAYSFFSPFDDNSPDGIPRPTPPYPPPYLPIWWKYPYSYANALGPDAMFSIHSKTGLLLARPRNIGQFVVGIVVKEYRKGVFIGETKRDYQFNVLPCDLTVTAEFDIDKIYCSNTISFHGKDKGEKFSWDFGVEGSVTDTSTEKSPTFTFPGNGRYLVTHTVRKGGCADSLSQFITIVNPQGHVFAPDDMTICYGKWPRLHVKDTAMIFTYEWSPDTWLSSSTVPDPECRALEDITYVIKKTYKNCIYYDTVTIHVEHPVADFEAKKLYCSRSVSFQSKGYGDSFFWDFGLAGSTADTATQQLPVFTYPADGMYRVTHIVRKGSCLATINRWITILSPEEHKFVPNDTTICLGDSAELSCDDFDSIPFTYTWLPPAWLSADTVENPLAFPPHDMTYVVKKMYEGCSYFDTVTVRVRHTEASFACSLQANCDGNRLTFTNESGGADTYAWFIGDSLASTEESPVFYFPHGCDVKGCLMTAAGKKCVDTAGFSFRFPLLDKIEFRPPNVITVNGDGLNDCFHLDPDQYPLDCQLQKVEIYNRWGEIVHNDPDNCWDGRDGRTGATLAAGVYYYVVRFAGKEYSGTITLLR